MAVRDGGSRALMAAYNAVNGTPAHVHPMLRDIVMREWGVDGIICTDGGGLRLLVSDHKAFPDLPRPRPPASRRASTTSSTATRSRSREAVASAACSTEARPRRALRGLFRVSIRLGLLDPPERVPYARIGRDGDPEPWAQPETRALVREVTRKSIVLLKNSAGLLPLDRDEGRARVAVVGRSRTTVLARLVLGHAAVRDLAARRHRARRDPGRRLARPVGINWVGDMSDAAVEIARGSDRSRSSASAATPKATPAGRW